MTLKRTKIHDLILTYLEDTNPERKIISGDIGKYISGHSSVIGISLLDETIESNLSKAPPMYKSVLPVIVTITQKNVKSEDAEEVGGKLLEKVRNAMELNKNFNPGFGSNKLFYAYKLTGQSIDYGQGIVYVTLNYDFYYVEDSGQIDY